MNDNKINFKFGSFQNEDEFNKQLSEFKNDIIESSRKNHAEAAARTSEKITSLSDEINDYQNTIVELISENANLNEIQTTNERNAQKEQDNAILGDFLTDIGIKSKFHDVTINSTNLNVDDIGTVETLDVLNDFMSEYPEFLERDEEKETIKPSKSPEFDNTKEIVFNHKKTYQ